MPDNKKILSHHDVLVLLSAKARDGSVTAMVSLERALRMTSDDDHDEMDDELDRLLGGEDA